VLTNLKKMLTIKNTIGRTKAEAIKNGSGRQPINVKKIVMIAVGITVVGVIAYFLLNRKKKEEGATVDADATDVTGQPDEILGASVETGGETGDGSTIDVPIEMSAN